MSIFMQLQFSEKNLYKSEKKRRNKSYGLAILTTFAPLYFLMEDNKLHSNITALIIKAFFEVYNKLGHGFLEKVYQNALILELQNYKLKCFSQYPVEVFYDGQKVGFYFADIIVDNCVIVEIKAAAGLCEGHEAQLVNYLRATDIEVGLLLNFGEKPTFKRKVFSARYKNLNKSSRS